MHTVVLTILFGVEVVHSYFDEPYRPQIHFSAPNMWLNDPNGLVYHNSVYHLFYQHHPYDVVWGPMHWGHAVSKDLIHWKLMPIVLFPDELGTMFSGCALVDYNNVTGLQASKNTNVMIAIFTQHQFANKATNDYSQYQCLAYSNDNGVKWSMYENNPILKSPGVKDFRDPKIFFYSNKYFVMSLAASDRIMFFKSYDLIKWTFLSEFGEGHGAHGGVWECPDLLYFQSFDVWILLVSINPGGANGGSLTQYYVGFFDGVTFRDNNPPETILWVDYGPDNYAGITWLGVKDKTVFIGWMSNWDYGTDIPTTSWRGQMTIPRELTVTRVGISTYLVSNPINLISIESDHLPTIQNIVLTRKFPSFVLYTNLASMLMNVRLSFRVNEMTASDSFAFCWSNEREKLCIVFNASNNGYSIDRSNVGAFINKNFILKPMAPRLVTWDTIQWQLILDVSSVEFFADNGLTAMTALYFPMAPLNQFHVEFNTNSYISQLRLQSCSVAFLKSIWRTNLGINYYKQKGTNHSMMD